MVIQNGQDLTMAIYRPDAKPGTSEPTLAVNVNDGLGFFLESLASGADLFENKEFTMVAVRDYREIGRGAYRVHRGQLQIIQELGEMQGIMQIMWHDMLDRTRRLVGAAR